MARGSERRTNYQFALLTIGVALTASGCGANDNNAKRTVFVATLPPTFRHARCLNVPPALVNAIRRGVTAQAGAPLRYAQAVRSADFSSSVYFVSADIQAAGLEGSDDVATWATNRLRVGGSIYSVDAFANKYSDWADGYEIGNLTMIDDGAELSQECVKAVAKR